MIHLLPRRNLELLEIYTPWQNLKSFADKSGVKRHFCTRNIIVY